MSGMDECKNATDRMTRKCHIDVTHPRSRRNKKELCSRFFCPSGLLFAGVLHGCHISLCMCDVCVRDQFVLNGIWCSIVTVHRSLLCVYIICDSNKTMMPNLIRLSLNSLPLIHSLAVYIGSAFKSSIERGCKINEVKVDGG